MKILDTRSKAQSRGYSLAEALVAAGLLMIGISAAASLTLTMNTQEEISWKVARGLNMLENCVMMCQLGVNGDESIRFIPSDPDATLEVILVANETNGGLTLEGNHYQVRIRPVMDAGSWSAGSWTGGSTSTLPERIVQAHAYRSTF